MTRGQRWRPEVGNDNDPALDRNASILNVTPLPEIPLRSVGLVPADDVATGPQLPAVPRTDAEAGWGLERRNPRRSTSTPPQSRPILSLPKRPRKFLSRNRLRWTLGVFVILALGLGIGLGLGVSLKHSPSGWFLPYNPGNSVGLRYFAVNLDYRVMVYELPDTIPVGNTAVATASAAYVAYDTDAFTHYSWSYTATSTVPTSTAAPSPSETDPYCQGGNGTYYVAYANRAVATYLRLCHYEIVTDVGLWGSSSTYNLSFTECVAYTAAQGSDAYLPPAMFVLNGDSVKSGCSFASFFVKVRPNVSSVQYELGVLVAYKSY